MNEERNVPLTGGLEGSGVELKGEYVDGLGRKEHAALLNNPARCKELWLDPFFEAMVYFRTWGEWPEEDKRKLQGDHNE